MILFYRPVQKLDDARAPIANPRLCIMASSTSGEILYKWQVFFKTTSEGNYTYEGILMYLHQLLDTSGYMLCPGLCKYPSEVRFRTTNLREWGVPFDRLDSRSCFLWHIESIQCHVKLPHHSLSS